MAIAKAPRFADLERATIQIGEGSNILTLDYAGARATHQGNSWWGVAVGFRAMQAAAGLLSQTSLWNRDDLSVVSGHPGPGVRDAIDFVTDCVTRNSFRLTEAQTGRTGCARDMNYQWWVSNGQVTAVISLLDDFVQEPFYDLLDRLGSDDERRGDRRQFEKFKAEMEACIWHQPLDASFHMECLSDALKPGELPAP